MATDSARIRTEDVRRDGRAALQVGGQRVVVFSLGGDFVAYVDACPHLGGPVCSRGSLHPFYTARVEEDGRVEPYFAEGGERVLACPWHGWEYDLRNGQCLADGTKWLRAATVVHDSDELIISL
ncbi:MAG: Rieske 2Fe-2S domain-containing protein [Nitriliruptorales bacterium]|nr:Rieske 2Fe-2S domain-containing protein [Nitriliruptorales bacterium]